MEVVSAIVEEIDEKFFIRISDEEPILIPISDDDPNEVKRSFNKIIRRLKKGAFEIELEEEEQDLFSQVAKEYIKQLNKEISEVYGEMEEYNLVEE